MQGQTVDYSYTLYDKSDGLPSNTVYDIVSDLDGILWVGTDAGLCKFDGSHIKVFTTDEGLPSNDIFQLYCDQKNRIWVLGMSSRIAYVHEDKVFNRFNDSNLAKIDVGNGYNHLFLKKNKQLMIIGSSKKMYLIDSNDRMNMIDLNKIGNSKPVYLALPSNDSLYLFGGDSLEVYVDKLYNLTQSKVPKRSVLILAELNGHYFYRDLEKNYYTETTKKDIDNNIFRIQNTGIRPILHNDLNQLLLIETNGILVYDQSDLRKPIKKLLPEYPILNYTQDQLKRNWYATRGSGLFATNSETHRIFRNNFGLNVNKFNAVIGNENELLVGDNKGKVTVIDRTTYRVKKVIDLSVFSKISIRITRMIRYKSKFVIATDDGCYLYTPGSTHIEEIMHRGAIKNLIIHQNQLVILHNSGMSTYDFTTKKYTLNLLHRMYSACEYRGQLIYGSETGLYTFTNQHYIPYTLNESFEHRIMDIFVQDSLMVLVTVNDGLFFVNGHHIVHKVNTNHGLSTNNCFHACVYNQQVYLATSNGINMYDPYKQLVNIMFESDGLASNTVNDIFIDKDTMYAATENGLSIIGLHDIVPPTLFELFSKPVIIDKDTFWRRDTFFNARTDHNFVIYLNALSYGVKGKIVYYYRYKDSVYTSTSDNKVPLTFTEPGEYSFEAYAVNMNKRLSNSIRLHIVIEPYFWQTWMFKVLVILVFITLLVLIILLVDKSTTNRERQKRLNDQKVHQLELESWQSKFNPHFLFNSLSSISSLIQTNRGERAVHFIQNFSFILRRTIQNSRKLLNTIDEEVKYLEHYLSLEIIKRNDLFKYSISYSSDTLNSYYIPSLLLQPVIENSLKHGIGPNLNGFIDIHFEMNLETIVVTISDNGSKANTPKKDSDQHHRSIGMKLIEDKITFMEKLLQKKIGFSTNIYSLTESESAVTTFVFPILTNDI